MKILATLLMGCLLVISTSCDKEIEDGVMKSDLSKDVELVTDFGIIILRLSDETPIHRNNFIKLVNKSAYDSVTFHRVIENFLIQTGDMTTKPASLDSSIYYSPYTYMIDAEVSPNLFHKRGALNAARLGDDQNPKQASDGTQFTIIQGKTYTDSMLTRNEERINSWRAYNIVINKPENKSSQAKLSSMFYQIDSLYLLETPESIAAIEVLNDSIAVIKSKLEDLADLELETMELYHYPEAHREVYKTIGGAAHLDQNYTVFGEVLKGMDIVDSIAAVQTGRYDKPINDVRFISAKMIERIDYN